jgi:hypothetical protein
VSTIFCEVKMKDTKACMLHLSHKADEAIERLRFEPPLDIMRRAPSRSDFVERAIWHYAEHLEELQQEISESGQRA